MYESNVMMKIKFNIFVMCFLTLMLIAQRSNALRDDQTSDGHKWKCKAINIDFCKDIGYNATIYMGFNPNPYTGKYSQEESEGVLNQFKSLVEKNCSKSLRLLLCSVYVPYCSTKIIKPITACRLLCEEVKSKCLPIMKYFGFPWPEALECSKFQKQNRFPSTCVNGGILSPKTTEITKQPSITSSRKTLTTLRRTAIRIHRNHISKITSTTTYCLVLYSRNRENYFFIDKFQACALGCTKDGLFTYDEKIIAEKWLSALACVCGLLCIMALFVVVFDYHKMCYPERTIVFITVCYLFYSLAYVVRIVYSREGISCQEENNRRYLLTDGSGNITCAATFLLTYCFSMAQNIWWVVLSLTWFLSGGMKWQPDAIKSKSAYFHVAAWGVPCAKTVVILVLRKIDVNELTGICYTGNRYENLSALQGFVLGPLFTYLIMGTIFLLSGFVALFKISSNCTTEPALPTKLQRPLLPVAVYAAFHIFFSTYVLASYFYEYVNKSAWYMDPKSSGPNFVVFLLRLIMDFFIGITASIWLLAIQLPRLYKKMKLKLNSPNLNNAAPPVNSVREPLRPDTRTSETSI